MKGSWYHHPNVSVLCSAGGRWQAGGGQADRDWWIPAQWAHGLYHTSRAASSAWGGGISTVLQVKNKTTDTSSQRMENKYTKSNFSVLFSAHFSCGDNIFYALVRSYLISPVDIFHETNWKRDSNLTAGRKSENQNYTRSQKLVNFFLRIFNWGPAGFQLPCWKHDCWTVCICVCAICILQSCFALNHFWQEIFQNRFSESPLIIHNNQQISRINHKLSCLLHASVLMMPITFISC